MSHSNPSAPNASNRTVSIRRVVLLLLFGATACMALTRPGRWVSERLLPQHIESVCAPPRLVSAPVDPKFQSAVTVAFRDLNLEGPREDWPFLTPTGERLVERLGRLDRWTDCVVFECGTRAADIEPHGWPDRETCVAIALSESVWMPRDLGWYANSGWRQWTLLLLDEQGRSLAATKLSALRPGWTLYDEDCQPWATQPDTSETEALPAVRSFHRGADGVIVAR